MFKYETHISCFLEHEEDTVLIWVNLNSKTPPGTITTLEFSDISDEYDLSQFLVR